MVVVAAGAGSAHKVLLISGKQTGSSTGSQTAFSRPISVVLPSTANQVSSDSDSNTSAGPPVRKRQRLTHLSPEEKALRRKLKNRVAAQTARDRKKAKMGELEQQVLELELENQKLHIENRLLREKTSGLLTENEELRQRLGLDTLDSKEKVQVLLSTGNDAGLGVGSSESAVLRLCVSAAGAGPAVPKSEDFSMDTDSPDSTDNESDLLLGILDILDPELFLKSCEQECEEPQVLLVGGGDPVPAATPAPLGAPSVKLEALNELIHFDHIYTKPVEEVSGGQSSDVESDEDEKIDEASFPITEVVVEEETVCIKDEPEEVVIPTCDGHSQVDDFFSGGSSAALSSLEKEACLADTYSDSGYEGSPSPFSDMSSPLCSESAWDDVFANELFPQLISV
ncbi:LOW QUALITY PROTEIN: X-box-binding protein 1 [Acanthochromis polyacanthus]|uniref:LOW QUALITY PROTEIN: X-box-binding protein 1 n=1 Tax=Acanthochromis polyacanthus TaxID=80966 RepID=UPI00223491F8|nr:LOW QUALITY PROTEIN: X-box-binding protein 1 [Acanthochromis polyacanthus]